MASKRIQGITIQIGADATKLTDALRSVEKQINSAKSSLKDVNNLLKVDPKNTELLTQKQKLLTEAIDSTKEKLKQEQDALKQLEGKEQTKEVEAQQEALKREIEATTQELKGLEKEYKEFGSVAQQQTKAAAEEMQAAGKKIEGVGKGLTSAGRTMTTYVTAPIVAAGTASVKKAAEFDESMSKVRAITNATSDDIAKMEELALEMGAKTKFSATEAAEAYTYMGMAGWKTEEMLSGLPGIMNLAAASGEDLASTSDIVTDALTAFGLTAKDSTHFANVLAAAATNSNTNVSMLGASFKYAANAAGTMNYSTEDVAIALGLMANNGIKADMAGTSLRNLINRMAKPTKESAAAMDTLGLALYNDEGKMYSLREVMEQLRDGMKNVKMSAEDFEKAASQLDAELEAGNITQKKYDKELEELTLQAFGAEEAEKARAAAMLGGTRAMGGLLAIANASEADFQQLANAIDTSSDSFAKLADGSIVPLSDAMAQGLEVIETYNGKAEAMSAIMEDNLNGDIRKLKASIEALAISLGELLTPELRESVDSLKDFIDNINAMDDSQKTAIINIGKFVAAIGPVLLVLGALVTGIGKVVWAMGTLKIAFGAGGALAGAGELLATVGAAIGSVLVPIGLVAAAVAVWVHNWEDIKEASRLLVERLQEDWGYIKEAAAALRDYLSPVFDFIKNIITSRIEEAKKILEITWNLITLLFGDKIEFIKGVIDGGFGYIYDTVAQKVQGVYDTVTGIFTEIQNFVSGIIEKAKQWGTDLIGNIKDGIESGVDGVKNAANNVGKAISDRLHFSEPETGYLSDFNTWMPDMMRQMAEQINAGVPGVAAAMQNVTGAMRGAVNPDYSGQLASINNNIGQLAAAGGGNITVPVYIGQQKFAQAVVSANQNNNYRSGGR